MFASGVLRGSGTGVRPEQSESDTSLGSGPSEGTEAWSALAHRGLGSGDSKCGAGWTVVPGGLGDRQGACCMARA